MLFMAKVPKFGRYGVPRPHLLHQAGVGRAQPLGEVAHQGAAEMQLRLDAHPLQRGRLEFGEQQVGHGFDAGLAQQLAAADVSQSLAYLSGSERQAR